MEINIQNIINSKHVISYNIPNKTDFYKASIIGPPDYDSEFILFFSTNTNDQRWYTSKTNRSILVKRLSKIKDNWIFVIDDIRLLASRKNYYILVNSVNLFIELLVKEHLGYLNTKVIAITGSVGKTTLARIISLLIESSQLIDVKRLTPLTLADFVFNKLETRTQFLITEVGLYYPGQITHLTNILSPYIGVITNIYDMHIGWNHIQSRSNLLTEKMCLLFNSQIRIVSSELFENYSISHSFYKNNVIYNSSNYINVVNSSKILPKTNVSKNILELIDIILDKCNCNNKRNISRTIQINSSLLRFHKYTIGPKEIYVDSHSSIAGYFQAMSCHWYKSVLLIILSLHFPIEENISENIQRIKKTFPLFNTILISNKLKHYFGNIGNERIKYISDNGFLKEIINEQTVIIHDPKGVRFLRNNEKKWKEIINSNPANYKTNYSN